MDLQILFCGFHFGGGIEKTFKPPFDFSWGEIALNCYSFETRVILLLSSVPWEKFKVEIVPNITVVTRNINDLSPLIKRHILSM